MRWKSRLNANDFWLDHDDDIKIKFTTGTINMNAVSDRCSCRGRSVVLRLGCRVGELVIRTVAVLIEDRSHVPPIGGIRAERGPF